METIQGKRSLDLSLTGLNERLTNYSHIALDLGTGDGRYVRTFAGAHPDWFVIGMDACRENLREHSRAKLANMLFVIARAHKLPSELHGLFSQVTINFPWGSLLDVLLAGDPGLIGGLLSTSRPNAQILLHLNGGALTEAGANLDVGVETIGANLKKYGWDLGTPHFIEHDDFSRIPSTWAKRLAYGRDPRAVRLSGRRAG